MASHAEATTRYVKAFTAAARCWELSQTRRCPKTGQKLCQGVSTIASAAALDFSVCPGQVPLTGRKPSTGVDASTHSGRHRRVISLLFSPCPRTHKRGDGTCDPRGILGSRFAARTRVWSCTPGVPPICNGCGFNRCGACTSRVDQGWKLRWRFRNEKVRAARTSQLHRGEGPTHGYGPLISGLGLRSASHLQHPCLACDNDRVHRFPPARQRPKFPGGSGSPRPVVTRCDWDRHQR